MKQFVYLSGLLLISLVSPLLAHESPVILVEADIYRVESIVSNDNSEGVQTEEVLEKSPTLVSDPITHSMEINFELSGNGNSSISRLRSNNFDSTLSVAGYYRGTKRIAKIKTTPFANKSLAVAALKTKTK